MEAELEQIKTRIANIENEGGTQIEMQNETDRLKRQKARLVRDIDESKKKSKDYEKTLKENQKATKDVARYQEIFDDEKQKEKTLEARLNRIKPLDDLKEQKETLESQIEEDKRVIEDENTSPSEREAAEARNTEREEELARLDQQIQEREEALPLRERVN